MQGRADEEGLTFVLKADIAFALLGPGGLDMKSWHSSTRDIRNGYQHPQCAGADSTAFSRFPIVPSALNSYLPQPPSA